MAVIPSPVFLLRLLSPTAVFLYTFSLLCASPTPPPHDSPITSVVVASYVPRRTLILTLLSLASLTFLGDGLSFVVYAVLDKSWSYNTGIEISAIIGIVAFAGLAALGTWKEIRGVQVWFSKYLRLAVTAALFFDIALVIILGLRFRNVPAPPHIPETPPPIQIRSLIHLIFPTLRVLILLPLLAALTTPRVVYTPIDIDDVDVQATSSSFLLPPESGAHPSTGLSPVAGLNPDATKYGTFRTTRSNISAPVTRAATPAPSTGPDQKPDKKPEIALDPSWGEVWRRIKRLSPYLWPTKSRYLQFLAAICMFILLLGRVINLALPITLGGLVRVLEGRSASSPWPFLFTYVALRFLQGSGGLAAIRDSLWAPVMQYSDREMSQLSFDHLLNLSFAWHTRRKTGEILRVLDRGAAINHTFELLLFNILPTFVDIAVALVAFCFFFEWVLALVVFLVMFTYVAASVILTQWRTKLRRQMNDRDVITRGIHTDCLLNYETVKYFGGEEHEGERYRDAVRQYQALEYKVIISLNLLNMVQNFIITLGLLIGSMLVAYRITQNKSDASDFVFFITYLVQLYGPLNQLGSIYRSVNQSLVDTERLLALLNEPTDVNDKPNAPDLIVNSGEIEFENVSFSYDGRAPALNGVSFRVPKGASVALVGESGAGKSTILRLLYRFYDLGEGEGRILIDGQDIRDVTQKSLRQSIGVVPQDSVLFNSSIGYNIGYGKFGATEEEIEAAAKSAQMHDRIATFPDGYKTKVGERGVRLSGGEKQRVAIARTLLKNPPILLLDEATSALDTSTEKDIQKALQNLVKGRSSLSIAHRLSTIASADIILVLKDGQIIEQGSHRELLALDGVFAAMWADQISATEDPAASLLGSTKKETSGYDVDDSSTAPDDKVSGPEAVAEDAIDLSETNDDNASKMAEGDNISSPADPTTPVAFPSFDGDQDEADLEPRDAPAEHAITTAPVETESPPTEPAGKPVERATPGVTFGTDVALPPSRTGTPDPDSEPKRKRISSQNFQRLARRISLTTKRQNSVTSLIPGLKRSDSPRTSVDAGETSGGSGSPAGSVDGSKSKDKKKDKKDKSKKGSSS